MSNRSKKNASQDVLCVIKSCDDAITEIQKLWPDVSVRYSLHFGGVSVPTYIEDCTEAELECAQSLSVTVYNPQNGEALTKREFDDLEKLAAEFRSGFMTSRKFAHEIISKPK